MPAASMVGMPTDPNPLKPAGLLRRIAAMTYDTLLLLAILMVAGFVTLIFTHGEAVAVGNYWFRALLWLLALAYFCGSWVRGGKTIGMKAWRLQVTKWDGASLDGHTAVLRFVAALLSWAVIGLGFLWVLIDPEKRAWHDRLSGTRIVITPKR
jgi:uncharacterized RDD family membrane protein YckC